MKSEFTKKKENKRKEIKRARENMWRIKYNY
jgi:hypothetical protein